MEGPTDGIPDPITIDKALQGITAHEYVLPAIQREFVWKPDQICAFFDSLMRRYPIGSFLFWEIPADDLGDYVFYDFIRNYHERRAAHCAIVPRDALPSGKPATAILDGQQRMTALNVGLRGSHAKRLPRKCWNNPDAFPKKKLYLNIAAPASENDDKLMYDFRFLTKEEAVDGNVDGAHWFPVPKIRDLTDGTDSVGIFKYIQKAGLAAENTFAFKTLDRLRQLVFQDAAISYYAVDERELDNVLDIFIRVNSGGTVLSYSDLLLSIATAQWSDRDARQDINALVESSTRTGKGFGFTKDVVLKAGLVLSDIGDIRFKVTNFNQQNMHRLEQGWDAISAGLTLAHRSSWRHSASASARSAADYVLLPLAYYVKMRGFDETYLTSDFVERRPGDGPRVGAALAAEGGHLGFWPGHACSAASARCHQEARPVGVPQWTRSRPRMAPIGKSLKFGPEEIDELAGPAVRQAADLRHALAAVSQVQFRDRAARRPRVPAEALLQEGTGQGGRPGRRARGLHRPDEWAAESPVAARRGQHQEAGHAAAGSGSTASPRASDQASGQAARESYPGACTTCTACPTACSASPSSTRRARRACVSGSRCCSACRFRSLSHGGSHG